MVCDAVSTPIKTTLYMESQLAARYFSTLPLNDAGVASTDL